MDWTELHGHWSGDDRHAVNVSPATDGTQPPPVWLTVDKATLKNCCNGYEYQVLVRLAGTLPADVRVRIVADRSASATRSFIGC